jgi:hypothetical protein
MVTRMCEVCGNGFEVTSNRRKYCGDTCREMRRGLESRLKAEDKWIPLINESLKEFKLEGDAFEILDYCRHQHQPNVNEAICGYLIYLTKAKGLCMLPNGVLMERFGIPRNRGTHSMTGGMRTVLKKLKVRDGIKVLTPKYEECIIGGYRRLPEIDVKVKDTARKLHKEFKKAGKVSFMPTVYAASLLYLASKLNNGKLLQREVAKNLGVTEVSIRNALHFYQKLLPTLKVEDKELQKMVKKYFKKVRK